MARLRSHSNDAAAPRNVPRVRGKSPYENANAWSQRRQDFRDETVRYLESNAAAATVVLSRADVGHLDARFPAAAVAGYCHNEPMEQLVDRTTG
jgi:hypothetical protein